MYEFLSPAPEDADVSHKDLNSQPGSEQNENRKVEDALDPYDQYLIDQWGGEGNINC